VVHLIAGMTPVIAKVSHAGSLFPDGGGDFFKVSQLGILFSQG